MSSPIRVISSLVLNRACDSTEVLSTPETRSRSRYRRAALNGMTSIGAKVVVLAATLISVPLTYRYLGAERYGLWMTMTSIVLFMGFADFGVGNGITTSIAAASGQGDVKGAQRSVSCGFYLLIAIALCLLAILLIVYHVIPWSSFYGTKGSLAASEAGPASAVLLICTVISMPVGVVARVQLGYQEGYISDLWNACGNLLGLIGIVYVATSHGKLPMLVAAVAGAPLFINAVNFFFEFNRVRPWLRPDISLFQMKEAFQLASVGALFFIQQVFGLIYYASDNIVISREMGAIQVARYAMLQRIFSIGLVAQYFMMPLWPAFREAVARKDHIWAKSAAKIAILSNVLVSTCCGIILLVISRYLVKRWSGTDIGEFGALQIGFALWVVVVGYVSAANAILNQPGVMSRHLVLFGSASITALVLKIISAHYGYLPGVIWSTIVSFGVIYILPTLILTKKTLQKMEDEVYA